jgi:hypothetical protein
MKHGVRLPRDKRDEMALRALAIFKEARNRSEALLIIETEFDVSNPTARNLISRGRYLTSAVGDPPRRGEETL